MTEIHLIGLKMAIMGAALTIAGAVGGYEAWFVFGGLALMFVSLFISDKVYTEEKKEK